jgi:hypothetical protein
LGELSGVQLGAGVIHLVEPFLAGFTVSSCDGGAHSMGFELLFLRHPARPAVRPASSTVRPAPPPAGKARKGTPRALHAAPPKQLELLAKFDGRRFYASRSL